MRFETLAMHAGERLDKAFGVGEVVMLWIMCCPRGLEY